MAMVAEEERRMISARTKAALAAAKARGTKLGGNRGVKPTAKMRALSTAARQQRADARAADIGPTIRALQAAGATSLRAIATGLNAQGIPTARGGGTWSAVQVQRVLQRL
jgi:DNA invertase Pin-like site-specific DNA recombinase